MDFRFPAASALAPLAEALAAAAASVARVAAGRSLSAELERADRDPDSRAAQADLCYGTLRRYGRSQAIVNALSRRAGTSDRESAGGKSKVVERRWAGNHEVAMIFVPIIQ